MTPQQLKAMKMALDALKLLTDTEQTFGALDYGDNAITAIEEVLAEHAMRETQRLGQEIEQEPVGFAGVKIWIGNQQIVRLLTQTELHHAIEPWLLVELNAKMCIKKLKEKNT